MRRRLAHECEWVRFHDRDGAGLVPDGYCESEAVAAIEQTDDGNVLVTVTAAAPLDVPAVAALKAVDIGNALNLGKRRFVATPGPALNAAIAAVRAALDEQEANPRMGH